MSFNGLFSIGLSGVNAFTTSLEAVSNNIANTQTTGYKRVRTDFSDLVSRATAGGAGIETGGVTAQNRQLITEQGAITRTASATDLAISGDGFFVVADTADAANGTMFTRAGGFSVQPDGSLTNASGHFLFAAPAGGASGLEAVNVNTQPTLFEATSALSFSGVFSDTAAIGETVSQRVQAIDANGAPVNLAVTYAKTAANNWSVTLAPEGGAAIASGTLVFDATGALDAGASTLPAAAALGGQSLSLDVSGLRQSAGATRVAAPTANGAALGALTGVAVSEDGVITANYSNGLSRDIYQIVLATFTNAESLSEGADSTFLLAATTDAPRFERPQSGRAGKIEGSALEISTVDIGREFSTLIETQRAYAANTRIITIADELWSTLTQTAA